MPNQAKSILNQRTLEQLLSDFEATETMEETMELFEIRGWLMEAIQEKMTPEQYDKWMDEYCQI